MSRKDYVAIAKSISVNLTGKIKEEKLDNFLLSLCHVMKRDNEHFDAGRFIQACKEEVVK
jgi:hypothetical protein